MTTHPTGNWITPSNRKASKDNFWTYQEFVQPFEVTMFLRTSTYIPAAEGPESLIFIEVIFLILDVSKKNVVVLTKIPKHSIEMHLKKMRKYFSSKVRLLFHFHF